MLIARAAVEDDLDAVVDLAQELHRLHHDAEPETYTAGIQPRDKLAGALDDAERLVLVAVASGTVVGYAYAREVARAETDYTLAVRYVEIDEVMTRPDARRQGGARTLLEAVQEWAQGRGVRDLRLSVRANNQAAVQAYEALGFRLASYRMRLTF